jgi:hypothetical protein
VRRGSRKHTLDWTSRPDFCVDLLKLARPARVTISADSMWMPRGHEAPEEARLETFGPSALPNVPIWSELRTWWLRHEAGANTPNWDLALTCLIDDRPGLLLVEAKANVPELSRGGKPLGTSASQSSQENHDHIGAAIADACTELRRLNPGIAISRDSHYQLANRVAFGWKLASLGLPTIVIYLGFTGDTGIADTERLRDDSHWQSVFADYAHGVVPQNMFDTKLECGSASMWLLMRSRPVLEPSPPPTPASPSGKHNITR